MLVICKRCVCVTGLLEELALWIGHDSIKDGRFEWMPSGTGETSRKSNSDMQYLAQVFGSANENLMTMKTRTYQSVKCVMTLYGPVDSDKEGSARNTMDFCVDVKEGSNTVVIFFTPSNIGERLLQKRDRSFFC